MIKSLHLQNFKLWKDTGDLKLAPITVLFGPNSSGKSSIIQLLLLLKQTAESPDRKSLFDFGTPKSRLVDLGSFQNILHNHSYDARLSFELSWNTRPFNLSFGYGPVKKVKELTLQCQAATEQTFIGIGPVISYARLSYMRYIAESNVFGIKQTDDKKYYLENDAPYLQRKSNGNSESLRFENKFYTFPDEVYGNYQNTSFLSDFVLSFEELMKSMIHIGPLREYPERRYLWTGTAPGNVGQRGERTVEALLASKKKASGDDGSSLESRVARWVVDMGLAKSFEVKHTSGNDYSVLLKTIDGKSESNIADVGFGISQVLPVLVQSYYADKGSVILMEQPEIHMHPKIQSDLADVFIDAAKMNDIQYIIESHSEYFLRRLQTRIAQQMITPDDVRIYFCSNTPDGAKIEELKTDEYGNISNWPKDFFGDIFGEVADRAQAEIERITGEAIE